MLVLGQRSHTNAQSRSELRLSWHPNQPGHEVASPSLRGNGGRGRGSVPRVADRFGMSSIRRDNVKERAGGPLLQ